jgi:carboxypeptidase PM20D1
MLRRLLLVISGIIAVLLSILLIRTLTFKSRQTHVHVKTAPEFDSLALEHFLSAIQFKTISFSDPALFDSVQFKGFRDFLQQTYPLTHEHLKKEIVAGHSLLFEWEGTDKNLKPYILMAHQDVVPIEEGTESIWTVDPFKGVVRDNFIWGRGAADDKINLIAIMESVEKLLKEGFQPSRTIYLAFGHDEEVGGTGAIAIAKRLQEKNVKADLVLDEGGIITRSKIPGMDKPVALLGTSEKGAMSLELRVQKSGGHSSMPEAETSIDILAKAITKLRENQFEPHFSPSTEGFLDYVGPEMPFGKRIAFANLWLFTPVVNSIYEKSGPGNAVIRTTIAPTIIKAGVKENVIPTVATAIINFRLLPGDSAGMIIEKVKTIIADERVEIKPQLPVREASAVTSTDHFAFKKVEQIVRSLSDSLIAAPFLMIAATDSRHFGEVSDGIIKFSPMYDPIGFHGIDERVGIESFRTSLWFFEQLIRDANTPTK